jgi:type VI secretion system protein ImpM
VSGGSVQQAGWYGKLPSLGDFAQRRLPTAFVDVWDDWLGAELARVRMRDDGWLQAYLSSPVWRFVLLPGALSPTSTAWSGVLMPSVDKVGRYFPLTLACEQPSLSTEAKDLDVMLAWLHDLDDIAADALHEDWTLEQLEHTLLQQGMPMPRPFDPEDTVIDLLPDIEAEGQTSLSDAFDALHVNGGPGLMLNAPRRLELARTLALQVAQQRRGLAVWWCDAPDDARVMISRGLPTQRWFDALFGLHAGASSIGEPSYNPA